MISVDFILFEMRRYVIKVGHFLIFLLFYTQVCLGASGSYEFYFDPNLQPSELKLANSIIGYEDGHLVGTSKSLYKVFGDSVFRLDSSKRFHVNDIIEVEGGVYIATSNFGAVNVNLNGPNILFTNLGGDVEGECWEVFEFASEVYFNCEFGIYKVVEKTNLEISVGSIASGHKPCVTPGKEHLLISCIDESIFIYRLNEKKLTKVEFESFVVGSLWLDDGFYVFTENNCIMLFEYDSTWGNGECNIEELDYSRGFDKVFPKKSAVVNDDKLVIIDDVVSKIILDGNEEINDFLIINSTVDKKIDIVFLTNLHGPRSLSSIKKLSNAGYGNPSEKYLSGFKLKSGEVAFSVGEDISIRSLEGDLEYFRIKNAGSVSSFSQLSREHLIGFTFKSEVIYFSLEPQGYKKLLGSYGGSIYDVVSNDDCIYFGVVGGKNPGLYKIDESLKVTKIVESVNPDTLAIIEEDTLIFVDRQNYIHVVKNENEIEIIKLEGLVKYGYSYCLGKHIQSVIYICLDGLGLVFVDLEDKRLFDLPNKIIQETVEVRDVLVDHHDNYWVFTDDGLIWLSRNLNDFYSIYLEGSERYIDFEYASSLFLDENELLAISDYNRFIVGIDTFYNRMELYKDISKDEIDFGYFLDGDSIKWVSDGLERDEMESFVRFVNYDYFVFGHLDVKYRVLDFSEKWSPLEDGLLTVLPKEFIQDGLDVDFHVKLTSGPSEDFYFTKKLSFEKPERFPEKFSNSSLIFFIFSLFLFYVCYCFWKAAIKNTKGKVGSYFYRGGEISEREVQREFYVKSENKMVSLIVCDVIYDLMDEYGIKSSSVKLSFISSVECFCGFTLFKEFIYSVFIDIFSGDFSYLEVQVFVEYGFMEMLIDIESVNKTATKRIKIRKRSYGILRDLNGKLVYEKVGSEEKRIKIFVPFENFAVGHEMTLHDLPHSKETKFVVAADCDVYQSEFSAANVRCFTLCSLSCIDVNDSFPNDNIFILYLLTSDLFFSNLTLVFKLKVNSQVLIVTFSQEVYDWCFTNFGNDVVVFRRGIDGELPSFVDELVFNISQSNYLEEGCHLFDSVGIKNYSLRGRDFNFIERFSVILRKNYKDSDFSRSKAAKLLALSERQLNRRLSAISDTNFLEIVKKYRLYKAKELLQQGGQVTAVTFDVGFTSTSYFCNCFRIEFGVTPGTLTNY